MTYYVMIIILDHASVHAHKCTNVRYDMHVFKRYGVVTMEAIFYYKCTSAYVHVLNSTC